MWNPCIFDVKVFFQFVDNARADITERSDEIGKNLDMYWHGLSGKILLLS